MVELEIETIDSQICQLKLLTTEFQRARLYLLCMCMFHESFGASQVLLIFSCVIILVVYWQQIVLPAHPVLLGAINQQISLQKFGPYRYLYMKPVVITVVCHSLLEWPHYCTYFWKH